jgi:hypothetical protein
LREADKPPSTLTAAVAVRIRSQRDLNIAALARRLGDKQVVAVKQPILSATANLFCGASPDGHSHEADWCFKVRSTKHGAQSYRSCSVRASTSFALRKNSAAWTWPNGTSEGRQRSISVD